MTRNCIALLLLFFVVPAKADCAADFECAGMSPWDESTNATLRLEVPGNPGFVQWHSRYDRDNRDSLLEITDEGPNGRHAAQVGVVGGMVWVSKGLDPKSRPGDQMAVVAIWAHEAAFILGRAFPAGPGSITERKQFAIDGQKRVKVLAFDSWRYIEAPWSAKGEIHPAASGAIAFDFVVTEKSGPFHFSGELGKNTLPIFDDKDPLDGWKVEREDLKSVADIRSEVAAELFPGKPDPSRDFTGFWKEKCENGFGTGIVHYGDEGKYATGFCGSSCFDPRHARLTFITGDRHYQVVSDNEIVEIYGKERRHLTRCSANTPPVGNF